MLIEINDLQNCMQVTTLSTHCSISRFLKLCNRLLDDKLLMVQDLPFGGLLNINYKKIRHNICFWLIHNFNVRFRRIDISVNKRYEVTSADMGLVFGLPTIG